MDAKRRRLACWAPLLFLGANAFAGEFARDALERFDTQELKYWGAADPKHKGKFNAVVTDPGGYIYSVQLGSHLGKDQGQITRITRCRLFFRELKSDGKGSWVEVQRSMRSATPECAATRPLPGDVVNRDPGVVPAEVARELANRKIRTGELEKVLDSFDFVVWAFSGAIHMNVDNPADTKTEPAGLVIFHKRSRNVEIVLEDVN